MKGLTKLASSLGLVAALGVPGSAQAATVSYALWIQGGPVQEFLNVAVPDSRIDDKTISLGDNSLTLNWYVPYDDLFDLSAIVSAIDGGAPTMFGAALWMVLDEPLAGPMKYKLTGSASMTDGGNNSISIGPTGKSYWGDALGGVFSGFKDFDRVDYAGTDNPLFTSASPVWPGTDGFLREGNDCPNGCGMAGLVIAFAGSGGGDLYSLNGRFENLSLVPPAEVPIPAALPLMLSALGVVGFIGTRRRRT